MGTTAIARSGHEPRCLSVAFALAAVRACTHQPHDRARLNRRLAHALQDRYRRRSSKRAWRWPHKKNTKPPGIPIVRAATHAQVKVAQALRVRSAGG